MSLCDACLGCRSEGSAGVSQSDQVHASRDSHGSRGLDSCMFQPGLDKSNNRGSGHVGGTAHTESALTLSHKGKPTVDYRPQPRAGEGRGCLPVESMDIEMIA